MDSNYTKQTLSDGLTLITVPMPSVESVTALVMIRVGSRNETAQIRGLSHFLEHMVFKGTKKYPTSQVLTSTVDGVGAEFNAFTGKEYTGFFVKAAAKYLPLALDILSQLVFYPLIEAKELEKEKGVIIEEINMYEDQPMAKVGWDFESLLYSNTPLGWESIGRKETVRRLQRKDFISYMNQWYKPENMVVGIVGAVERIKDPRQRAGRQESRIKNLVEEYFEKKPLTPGVAGSLRASNTRCWGQEKLVFKQNEPSLKIRFKKTEQAHLCLGVRTFKRMHKDRYALAVLTTVLGGNMSSRLFLEVREKRGLAYYVRTRPEAYLDNGYLVTQAGTDIGKVSETIKVILEEYNKISNIKYQISKRELVKAKEFLKGRLILELEDSKEVASLYTEDWLMERQIHTPQQLMRKIDEVNLEDLSRLGKKIFAPERLNLAIIGPYKDGDRQKFEKIIK